MSNVDIKLTSKHKKLSQKKVYFGWLNYLPFNNDQLTQSKGGFSQCKHRFFFNFLLLCPQILCFGTVPGSTKSKNAILQPYQRSNNASIHGHNFRLIQSILCLEKCCFYTILCVYILYVCKKNIFQVTFTENIFLWDTSGGTWVE